MSIVDRIDAVTGIPQELIGRTVLPVPKSVKIELSPRCNLRCGFCSLRTRKDQPTTDMDFDLFKRITTEMRELGVEEIGLFYLGESMMNPDLLTRALEWCKHELRFPYVFLTSNGGLAEPGIVNTLMFLGLDSLKWSVNACSPEQYEQIMGVGSKYFYKAISNIQEAWRIRERGGYRTKLYASSIRFDGEQHARMEAFVKETILPYVDEWYELPLYGMSMTAEAVAQRIGYRPTHGNQGRIDPATGLPNRDPLPCWSTIMEGHVRYDGHFALCCFSADDRFDVGSLKDQGFMEVWNSKKMQDVRAAQWRTIKEGPGALAGTPCEVCAAY